MRQSRGLAWLPEGGAFGGQLASDPSPGSEPTVISPWGSFPWWDKKAARNQPLEADLPGGEGGLELTCHGDLGQGRLWELSERPCQLVPGHRGAECGQF